MRKLRLISLFCALATVLMCFSGFAAFATAPKLWEVSDGAGQEGMSYALNQTNFQLFCETNLNADKIQGNYTLLEDVKVNDGYAIDWKDQYPTTYWGTAVGKEFSGVFDGNGKTISGICVIGATPTTKVGLFRMVSGEVKNLRLVNSYFQSNAYKTAMEDDEASKNVEDENTKLEDIGTKKYVEYDTHDKGYAAYKKIYNADPANAANQLKDTDYLTLDLTKEPSKSFFANFWLPYVENVEKNPSHDMYENARYVEAGSIAARVTGKITNIYSEAILNNPSKTSYAPGTYDGTSDMVIGGIVGMMSTGSDVSNCVFAGKILNNVGTTGGIVGVIANYARGLKITNCLNVGQVVSLYDRTGAILGWDKSLSCTVDRCMNLSSALGERGTIGTGNPGEVYGSGENHFMRITNFVVVKGMRSASKNLTSGSTKFATKAYSMYELTLSELLDASVVSASGKLQGWNYEDGYVPNPTSHTKIGLGEIFSAATFGLKTDATSVRVSPDNAGLRFETTIGNADLLPYLKPIGATYEMKTLITSADYIKGATSSTGLTTSNFSVEGLKDISKPYVETVATKNLRVLAKDGRNAFAGSVVNINDKSMNYIGIGYISISYKGQVYNIYADYNAAMLTTSVSNAAQTELDDVETEATADYANAVVNAEGATVYSKYTADQYEILKTLVAK